ncbi:MAG: hypothetical protein RJA99_1231 [Pseudomonadota bacterium]|jgi:hypothetical protein
MTGGMRYGAGRPAFRPCAAHYMSIDVRRLAREGLLSRPGWSGWTWSQDGERIGSIGLRVNPGLSVTFEFNQTRQGKSRPVSATAWLESTPCAFGGRRWWWRCPNCSRRCARLFIVTGGLGCLSCLRMVHLSQRMTPIDRSWRRTQKAEAALGMDGSGRRRLHQRTRERLYDVLGREEDFRDAAVGFAIERLWANAPARVRAARGERR